MRSMLILTAALITIFGLGAHGYAKQKENLYGSKKSVTAKINNENIEDNSEEINTAGNSKVKWLKVENIWRSMPSFDKYGNEITDRARNNMRQNSDLLKANQNRSKETASNPEMK